MTSVGARKRRRSRSQILKMIVCTPLSNGYHTWIKAISFFFYSRACLLFSVRFFFRDGVGIFRFFSSRSRWECDCPLPQKLTGLDVGTLQLDYHKYPVLWNDRQGLPRLPPDAFAAGYFHSSVFFFLGCILYFSTGKKEKKNNGGIPKSPRLFFLNNIFLSVNDMRCGDQTRFP